VEWQAVSQFKQSRGDLVELDRRIADAEMEIARQTVLMERLAGDGQDTTQAHARLNEMKGGMAGMYAHRKLLLQRREERA
jgi:hypothetical protein